MSAGTDNALQSDRQQNAGFRCSICHEWHDQLPMSYSVKVPQAVAAIPEAELDSRVVFSLDQCVIDKQSFYIRGRIPVPIIGQADAFIWGVWAKVDEPDFVRANNMWKVEGREKEPQYRGWLNTPLPLYKDTANLELRILTQIVGRRPHFELADITHPLALEQRNGITMERVREIAEWFIHPAE